MNLADESVLYYLLDKGVISTGDITSGDAMVVPFHTRNNIYKILFNGKRKDLFLKQSELQHEQIYKLSKNEAYVNDMISGSVEYAALKHNVPEMVHCDKERNIIVFEYLSGTNNLHEYYFTTKVLEPEIAVQQGHILSSYHMGLKDEKHRSHFMQQMPWILKMVDWIPENTFTTEPLKAQLMKYVIEYANLKQLIAELRNSWEYSCLMHGDIKWANFILKPGAETKKVYLTDWETSDIGDAAWDVGGLMQSYFSVWIFATSAPAAKNPDGTSRPEFQLDTDKMQRSIVSFWTTYARARGFDKAAKKAFLLKSARCAAARLIQTSIEALYGDIKAVDPYHYGCVRAAHNILSNPEFAVQQLFGANIYEQ